MDQAMHYVYDVPNASYGIGALLLLILAVVVIAFVVYHHSAKMRQDIAIIEAKIDALLGKTSSAPTVTPIAATPASPPAASPVATTTNNTPST